MGSGIATGPNAAEDAARMAIHSPLLDDVSIEGATSILVNITDTTGKPIDGLVSWQLTGPAGVNGPAWPPHAAYSGSGTMD